MHKFAANHFNLPLWIKVLLILNFFRQPIIKDFTKPCFYFESKQLILRSDSVAAASLLTEQQRFGAIAPEFSLTSADWALCWVTVGCLPVNRQLRDAAVRCLQTSLLCPARIHMLTVTSSGAARCLLLRKHLSTLDKLDKNTFNKKQCWWTRQ